MTHCCAIYVRYSDDQQRATSLDDQMRRCKETALKNGISLEQVKIYQDVAITGKFEGEAKRKGLRQLLEDS